MPELKTSPCLSNCSKSVPAATLTGPATFPSVRGRVPSHNTRRRKGDVCWAHSIEEVQLFFTVFGFLLCLLPRCCMGWTNTLWLLEQAVSFTNVWKGCSKTSDLFTAFFLLFEWQTKNSQKPGAVKGDSCLDHHLYFPFLRFQMPTIKGNEIERVNTEEQQQSTLKVKVSYLDVVFKVCIDPSDRMPEASVTFEPGLCLAFILQLRQRNCSTLRTELCGRVGNRNQKRIFSCFSVSEQETACYQLCAGSEGLFNITIDKDSLLL